MASYLSNLLDKLKGDDLLQANLQSAHPRINFITVYNPSLSNPKKEDPAELSKSIVCFVDDNLSIELHAKLTIVGIIRGSCSMLHELLPSLQDSPTVIHLDGSSIVVVDLDGSNKLACLISLPDALNTRKPLVQKQVAKLLLEHHRLFVILHSSFDTLLKSSLLSLSLSRFYKDFLTNYNAATSSFFGPKSLIWPNTLCYSGVFLAFPTGSFKKSSVRVPDSLKPDFTRILQKCPFLPTAAFVSLLNPVSQKQSGLVYANSTILLSATVPEADLRSLHNMLELFAYQNRLDRQSLGKRNVFSDLFTAADHEEASNEYTEADEPAEDEDLSSMLPQLNSAAALQVLNPIALTNSLVVLPLSTTLNGLKYLGLVMQYPWTSQSETPQENTEIVPDTKEEKPAFVIGLGNTDDVENITSFLVYLNTTLDHQNEIIEYLLVVYKHGDVVVSLLFPSSVQELSETSFYTTVQEKICEPIIELVEECKAISASGMVLSSSMTTLPTPMDTLIHEKREVDDDFFYIVYDPRDQSYQTSLPFLPAPILLVQNTHTEVARVTQQYRNAFFHLHDQIADYFIVKGSANIFDGDCGVKEHLHKFSVNKYNDWLMYFIRYKQKSILIIRNFNSKSKQKSKPRPEPSEELVFLSSWAESMYGYAHMGFLGSLGEDVRMWLGSFGEQQEPDFNQGQ